MRHNTKDSTLEKNYIQKYRFLIREYELVKSKQHPDFKFVQDFYKAHDTDRRSFIKYYNRFKQSGKDIDLLPRKRGPKWKSRRPIPFIEEKVKELRLKGNNRYEIVAILKPDLKQFTPSPSGVYNIIKRYKLNRLTPKMNASKRKIIKEKAGELGHIDTHYLNKGIVTWDTQRYYLVAVIDSCTRIVWAEVIKDVQALTVMFAIMRCFNVIKSEFDIQFQEVLTDNGPEFGLKTSKRKAGHPFQRMLMEVGIKQRHIRPYRPQTNGKIERFWRTIEEDLFSETNFDSEQELREELLQYLYYYNYERPHQGINGLSPTDFNKNCPRIT